MNVFDFLFENTSTFEKKLILGTKEPKSFRVIYQESIKLAGYLRMKLGQKKKIVLMAQNSSFFIMAYLGILKSGNICVPLSPGIEPERFQFITDKTNSRTGFISDIVKNRLNPSLDCITEKILKEIMEGEYELPSADEEFDGNCIAEILFTSGSSALPKGVMLSHTNIISNTGSIVQYLGLSDKDIMMVVLPFFYCYGLSLLHTHIRAGGSLVLNNSFIFLGSTVNDLNKYCCTGFAGVPSHFQILLRKSALFKSTKFPFLRYVTQAGGKLHNVFIDEFTETFPDIQFFVMYGQTEATARLSYLPPSMIKAKSGSIGKGIPGVELKVVNGKGIQVVPGETGEILARGKNVMKGYFEDQGLTTGTIRNNWLYTGDLATIDEEGYIYITGRKKEFIKAGGRRISPKEIEEVVVMMKGVIDCKAEAVTDPLNGEGIRVAVVVNESGNEITSESLRQFCAERLQNYKVPTEVVFNESMELSITGKKVKLI